MASILSTQNLSIQKPSGELIAKIPNLELESGKLLAISGDNGSGKSTLVRTLLGQHNYYQGTYFLDDHYLQKVAYLPQSVQTEVSLPMSIADVFEVCLGRTVDHTETFGLLENKHFSLNWESASGGEKKRCLLARALLQNPRLLILDEPFNHLDRQSRTVIAKTIANFLANQSNFAIVISHEKTIIQDAFSQSQICELKL